MPAPAYRLFVRLEAWEFLAGCPSQEQRRVVMLFRDLAQRPHQDGDYQESDDAGRRLEVRVVSKSAVVFWADHAVKELKIINVRPADRR